MGLSVSEEVGAKAGQEILVLWLFKGSVCRHRYEALGLLGFDTGMGPEVSWCPTRHGQTQVWDSDLLLSKEVGPRRWVCRCPKRPEVAQE